MGDKELQKTGCIYNAYVQWVTYLWFNEENVQISKNKATRWQTMIIGSWRFGVKGFFSTWKEPSGPWRGDDSAAPSPLSPGQGPAALTCPGAGRAACAKRKQNWLLWPFFLETMTPPPNSPSLHAALGPTRKTQKFCNLLSISSLVKISRFQ